MPSCGMRGVWGGLGPTRESAPQREDTHLDSGSGPARPGQRSPQGGICLPGCLTHNQQPPARCTVGVGLKDTPVGTAADVHGDSARLEPPRQRCQHTAHRTGKAPGAGWGADKAGSPGRV